MNISDLRPPSFLKRCAAVWVDLVLLLGAYLVLGFTFQHLFDADAYPKRTGMQLYSERDFAVYWFFVSNTFILSGLYLLIAYRFFGVTYGQRIVGIRLFREDGRRLSLGNILLRILAVEIKWFIVCFPGPIAAFVFVLMTASFLNPAFSMLLLLAALLGLLFRSITKYKQGETQSWTDRLSRTVLADAFEPDASRNGGAQKL